MAKFDYCIKEGIKLTNNGLEVQNSYEAEVQTSGRKMHSTTLVKLIASPKYALRTSSLFIYYRRLWEHGKCSAKVYLVFPLAVKFQRSSE